MAAVASENDMNAGNAPNALLMGACDDDDNELSEEQKKIIEERLKALQARFKAFEEKTLKQKVDELQLSNEGLGEKEAEMALRVCNNNEFEANDRLSDPEDGEVFMRALRCMVREERRLTTLKGRAATAAQAKLARRQARLRKRRGDQQWAEEDSDAEQGSDPEDWSDDEPETEDDEIVQEVAHGVHFVRHSKKHVTVGRLRLDDALKQLAAAQAAAEARKAEAEAAKVEASKMGRDAEGTVASGGEGGESSGGADGEDAVNAEDPGAAVADEPAGELDMSDLMLGWSEARIKAWNGRSKNENAYYYRFNAPGEEQRTKGWTPEEHQLFMDTLAKCPDGKADYVWGLFSKNIPGRVGYQCSNYYRTLVKNGTVVDDNYMVDESGQMRFNLKNKGFDRPAKVDENGQPVVVQKKRPAPKAPKPKKEPKPKKPKTKPKKKPKDDDKEFRCSAKLTVTRRSGRNAGATKKYTDGDDSDEDEDFDEAPVLPGFIDPLTKMQVEDPAISPYGHVCGYETWCRVLRNFDSKDTCPFTRQPLKRRELVKLTHENIEEYRSKIVENQQTAN